MAGRPFRNRDLYGHSETHSRCCLKTIRSPLEVSVHDQRERKYLGAIDRKGIAARLLLRFDPYWVFDAEQHGSATIPLNLGFGKLINLHGQLVNAYIQPEFLARRPPYPGNNPPKFTLPHSLSSAYPKRLNARDESRLRRSQKRTSMQTEWHKRLAGLVSWWQKQSFAGKHSWPIKTGLTALLCLSIGHLLGLRHSYWAANHSHRHHGVDNSTTLAAGRDRPNRHLYRCLFGMGHLLCLAWLFFGLCFSCRIVQFSSACR